MARITPKDPSTKLVCDGEPITDFIVATEAAFLGLDLSSGPGATATHEVFIVPAGMTADEVRHRLETWEQMRDALIWISRVAGNLPDDSITDRTGPNDAAHRGLMVVEARRLAREALAAAEKRT